MLYSVCVNIFYFTFQEVSNKNIVAISEFSIKVLALLKKKVILFDPPRTDFCV